MALETMVTWLAALAVPLWLAGEQILAWWMFRTEAQSPMEPAGLYVVDSRVPVSAGMVEATAVHQAPPQAA